jgi:hypothetical protein
MCPDMASSPQDKNLEVFWSQTEHLLNSQPPKLW